MKKLKFFTDQCVPNSIIEAIQNMSFEVLKLKDFIPKDSPDHDVILKAQKLNSILLTLNGDFADIIVYPPSKYKGIIAIQLKNHPEIIPYVMKTLKKYFFLHKNMAHYNGKLLIVEAYRIRVRE